MESVVCMYIFLLLFACNHQFSPASHLLDFMMLLFTSKFGRFGTNKTFNNLIQCLDKPLDFIHFDISLAKPPKSVAG